MTHWQACLFERTCSWNDGSLAKRVAYWQSSGFGVAGSLDRVHERKVGQPLQEQDEMDKADNIDRFVQ